MNETTYPIPNETRAQFQLRTRWIPAALYLSAAIVLIAIVRLIGI